MSAMITCFSPKKMINAVYFKLFIIIFAFALYGGDKDQSVDDRNASFNKIMNDFTQKQNEVNPSSYNEFKSRPQGKKPALVFLMPDSCIPIIYFKQVSKFFDSVRNCSKVPKKDKSVLLRNFLDHLQLLSHEAIRTRSCAKLIQADRLNLLQELHKSYTLPAILNDPDMFCKFRMVEGVLDGSIEDLLRKKIISRETWMAFGVIKKTIAKEKEHFIDPMFITDPMNLYDNFNEGKVLTKDEKTTLYLDAVVRGLETHFKWGIVERNLEVINGIWKCKDFQSAFDDYELLYLYSRNSLSKNTEQEMASPDKLRFNAVLQSILRDAVWPDGLDFTRYFSIPRMVFAKSIPERDSVLLLRSIEDFGYGHRKYAIRLEDMKDSIQRSATCKTFDSLVALEMDTILLMLSEETRKPIQTPRPLSITISGKENPDFFSAYAIMSGISAWSLFLDKHGVAFDTVWLKTIFQLKDSVGFSVKENSYNEFGNRLEKNSKDFSIERINNLRLLFGIYFYFFGELDTEKLRRIISGQSTLNATIFELILPHDYINHR